MLTDRLIEFHRTLQPAPPHFGGTGALVLHPDPRDYDYRLLPGVCDVLEAGVPDSFSLTQYITGPPLNQGSEPSCVAFSTCNLSALDGVEDGGPWLVFDGHGLYREAGGNGTNGVDTRVVLDIVTKQGTPLLSGGRKQTVGTYVFLPQVPGQFRQAAMAAIAAGHACTVALLLPEGFGTASSGPMTSAYHQVDMVAYRRTPKEQVQIYNSWGPSFGQSGLAWLDFDYLEQQGMQNNYCYGYATTPAVVNPNPPPPSGVTITGLVTGGATAALAVGQSYPLNPGDVLSITSIQGQPAPPPPPPPPPGSLMVGIIARRYSNNSVALWVTARDSAGFIVGTAAGSIGGIPLPPEPTHSNGIPAVWQIADVPLNATAQVTVTAPDGRTGSGSQAV